MFEREGRIPAITGIGKSRGRVNVTVEDTARYLDRPVRAVAKLMEKVGIESRGHVEKKKQVTSDLGVEALEQALQMAEIDKNELKALVFGTSSPDYLAVTTAAIVQDKLGLSKTVRVYDVEAACTGWVQAFVNTVTDLSSPYGSGGPQAAFGVETTSLFLDKRNAATALLFGDAGGVTIVDLVVPDEGAPTAMDFEFGGDGAYAKKLYVPAGGSSLPASRSTVEKHQHALYMEGDVIKEQAVKWMVDLSKKVLEKTGIPLEEVNLFVPHQANLQIIKCTAEELNFPMEKVMVTIGHYGNTSAASIPTAMREAWEEGKLKRNHIVLVATFGAGLTFAAAIIPMVGLPKR